MRPIIYTVIVCLLSSYSNIAVALDDKPTPKRDLPNTATHPSVITEPTTPNEITRPIEVLKPEDIIDEAIGSAAKPTPADELDKAMAAQTADAKKNEIRNKKLHKKRNYKRTRYKNGRRIPVEQDEDSTVVPDKR